MPFDFETAVAVQESPETKKESTGPAFDFASARPAPEEKDGQIIESYTPKRENLIDVIGRTVKNMALAGPGVATGDINGESLADATGLTEKAQKSQFEAQRTRAAAVYSIAEASGLPYSEVDQHFNDLIKPVQTVEGKARGAAEMPLAGPLAFGARIKSKQEASPYTGISIDPTSGKDFLMLAGLLFPVEVPIAGAGMAGEVLTTTTFEFLKNPAATFKGLMLFAGLDKLIPTEKLIPKDTPDNVRNAILTADFIVKGAMTAGIYKSANAIVDEALERFTLNKLVEYKLPTKVRIEPHQVKDLFQTGKLTSAEEKDILNSLNLTRPQIRAAIDNGVTVEIPAQKLTRVADKPWYGKFKEIFGLDATDEILVEAAGKSKKLPRALITDEAGNRVKPVERVEQLFNPGKSLTPAQTLVETNAMNQLRNNFEGSMESYLKRTEKTYGSRLVASADEAKYVFGVGPELMAAVHEPSSALATLHREMLLADKTTKGKPIAIMAGGSGDGKTHMVKEFLNPASKDFAGFFDTNTNNVETALKNIKMIKDSGRPAVIMYVERDPVKAWDAVIERGQRTGRPVPMDIHIANQGARTTVKKLAKQFADDPKVDFVLWNNSGKKLNEIDVEKLSDIDYTSNVEKENLRRKLNERLNEHIEQGKLSKAQAESYRFREGSGAAADPQADKKGDTGRIQQEPTREVKPASASAESEKSTELIDQKYFDGFKVQGTVDSARATDALVEKIKSDLDSGKKITLKNKGEKDVEIVGVSRGMLQDSKGQRWGTLPIQTGGATLEIKNAITESAPKKTEKTPEALPKATEPSKTIPPKNPTPPESAPGGVLPTGEEGTSRAFERAKDKWETELALEPQAMYTKIGIADQMARAFDFIKAEPDLARRVAFGMEPAPNGLRETAVAIAYAENQKELGNLKEFSDSYRSRSLRQTARGQEIVLERGAATNINDPEHFIKQVLEARMSQQGRKLWQLSAKPEKEITGKKGFEKIRQEVKPLKRTVSETRKMDIEAAQRIIDSLIC